MNPELFSLWWWNRIFTIYLLVIDGFKLAIFGPMIRITVIVFFVLGIYVKAHSQQPILLPPFGHVAFSTDFDIDVNSKTIVSVGIDGKMIFWDIASQKAFKKVEAHALEIYSVRYSWNGTYIITSSVDEKVKIWDSNGNLKNEINTGSSNLFADFNREENKIAVASADGHCRVYEYPSLKLLFDFKGTESRLNCAIFSTNGKLVFTGSEGGTVRAYDVLSEGKQMLDYTVEPAIKMISFDWSGSAMIVHTQDGMGEIYLLPAFESIGRLPVPTVDYKSGAAAFCSQMDISPDSKWLAWANANGQVQFVTGETLVKSAREKKQFETSMLQLPHTDFIAKVKFSPDMKYLVTLGHDKKMMVIEIKDVDLSNVADQYMSVKVIMQHSDYVRSLFFDEEKTLQIRGNYTYSWNLKTGEHSTASIFDSRAKFLRDELTKVEYGKLTVYVDAKKDIILVDVDGKLTDPTQIIWSKNRKMAAFVHIGKVYLLNAETNAITSDYSTTWRILPEEYALTNTGTLMVSIKEEVFAYDTKGKKLWNKKMDATVSYLSVSPNDELLAVANFGTSLPVLNTKDGSEKMKLKTEEAEAQVVCFLPDNNQIAYTGFYGGIGLVDIAAKSKKLLIETEDFSVFEMCVSDDGKLIATVGYDRLITIYSLEIKKNLFDIFPMQENGMAIVNEDNFYMSDKKAYQELAYWYNGKIYTGDQFDAQYNRPDIVLNSSPYANAEYVNILTETWKKRMKRLGIKENGLQDSKTEIVIANADQIKTNTNEKTISVELKIKDSLNHPQKLLVTLNDVPLYGREGMDISKNNSDQDLKLDLPLIPDKNILKFTTIDENGVASMPEILVINSHYEDKAQLYIVTIGTSEYKDTRFNLNYAAKDAEDMASAFKGNKTFAKVNSLTITNEKVTPKCTTQIQTFLKDAKPEDVVLVFIAGHGVLDNEYNYYLATHETDFTKPEEGSIRYETIENLFDGVAAIRKTLLIDACHSGEVDKSEMLAVTATSTEKNDKVKFRSSGAGVLTNSANAKTSLLVKELFADMRSGTGATVLSSAGGAEYAMESAEYKNGIFTYCLLDGMKSKNADLNGDGSIMLSELQQYLGNRVSELSDGKQRPTSRVENLSMDFKVW